ncbi:hypothetical protein BJ944DRAFT_41065 [Cunninghamella echinulata]|nr:hypothetical protein BJ944DRAFT_41065 [Cunninghamella echinulata]
MQYSQQHKQLNQLPFNHSSVPSPSLSTSIPFSIKSIFFKPYHQLVSVGYKSCGIRNRSTIADKDKNNQQSKSAFKNTNYHHHYKYNTNKITSSISSPSLSFTLFKKRLPSKSTSLHSLKRLEPIVHYNGPYHTIDQLPDEKWQWIRHPSLAESQQGLQNPLANWHSSSLVFRKPYRPFSSLSSSATNPKLLIPKAMLYLRVLQITSQDTSKPGLFRCEVKIGDEICSSAYIASEKCGKNSVQTNLDETFLFDITEPRDATICIYSKKKTGIPFSQTKYQMSQQEQYIGHHNFNIQLSSTQKNVQRHVMVDQYGHHFQIVVVYGVYISHRCQTMINQSVLIEDNLTVQVRGTSTPKLERFWAVVRGVQLELYDFDFKESRSPRYIIPLHTLIHAYHGGIDDQEGLLLMDSNQLILQFSEETIDDACQNIFLEYPDFECQMYILAENLQKSKQWEHIFNYIVSIFDECRQETSQYDDIMDGGDGNKEKFYYPFQYDNKYQQYSVVPFQFLW